MQNIVQIIDAKRENDLQMLQEVLPSCIEKVALEAGVEGIQKFFDGYKDSIDSQIKAA